MKFVLVLPNRWVSKVGLALGLSACVWGCAAVSGLDEFSIDENTAGAGGSDGASTSSSSASSGGGSTSSSSASSSSGASSSSSGASSSSSASSSSGGGPVTGMVIAEYYQSGSKNGASYNSDYAVLENTGTAPVNLTGWAFQHLKTGAGWKVLPLPNVTLAQGDAFLIQLYYDQNATLQGAALQSPNIVAPQSSDWNLSTTNGEALAITNDTQTITACNAPNIIDLVGFNLDSPCFEGLTWAPTSTPTQSVHRKNGETLDTNQNGSDFELGPPSP